MLIGVPIGHAQRPGQVVLEGNEHAAAGDAFVNVSQNVEIPIVVAPECPGWVRSTRRAAQHATIVSGQVDAGTRGEKVFDPGRPFLVGQGRRVIDSQLAQRRTEIDLTSVVGLAEQRAQDGLPDGVDMNRARYVTELEDGSPRMAYLRGSHVQPPKLFFDGR